MFDNESGLELNTVFGFPSFAESHSGERYGERSVEKTPNVRVRRSTVHEEYSVVPRLSMQKRDSLINWHA